MKKALKLSSGRLCVGSVELSSISSAGTSRRSYRCCASIITTRRHRRFGLGVIWSYDVGLPVSWGDYDFLVTMKIRSIISIVMLMWIVIPWIIIAIPIRHCVVDWTAGNGYRCIRIFHSCDSVTATKEEREKYDEKC